LQRSHIIDKKPKRKNKSLNKQSKQVGRKRREATAVTLTQRKVEKRGTLGNRLKKKKNHKKEQGYCLIYQHRKSTTKAMVKNRLEKGYAEKGP